MAGYSVTYSVVDNATRQIDAINKRITAMRAPMDRMSRSVSRFVDVSGLRKVGQGFEWIGKAASSVFRTLSAIVPVMGAITGAASIAGMVKLVNTYADWAHQLVQTADNIGITTQELQRFDDATRLAGGNAADMEGSLKGLHDNLSAMVTGQGNAAEVAQALNQIGVNARDATGHLRPMGDLMPEIIKKIAAMKDPYDRARIATMLLGSQGDKLVETFRQSHGGFDQAFKDAARYTELTDEQKRSLQEFTEAQGRAGVAFDHLGQQISVVLARDFAPLLNRLSEFVEKHTPEIVAAVDQISQKFAAWLQGVDWSKVEDGIKTLLDSLKWVIDHLDTIKEVAEGIAVLFAAKWAIGMVASIAQVTAAIGIAGGTVGLLGGLGAVVLATMLIIDHWKDFGQIATDVLKGIESAASRSSQVMSDFWAGRRTNPTPQPGEAPQYLPQTGTPGGAWAPPPPGQPQTAPPSQYLPQTGTPGGAWAPPGGAAPAPANLSLPADTTARGAAITARLATDLGLTTEQAAGITGNLQAESGLQAVQERNPIGGGRGGFGWAQWTGPRRDQFERYAAENKLDPKSDEANYGFLRKELQGPENSKLLDQLRALKGPDTARQSAATVERMYERPAVSNAGVRGDYADRFAAAPPIAAAPPVTVPPQAPVNGSVNVDITHKNAPPNSAVTATGTGSVNVAPVRVEHQDMASI